MLQVGSFYKIKAGSRLFIDNLTIRITYIDHTVVRYSYVELNDFSSSCSNTPRIINYLIPLSSLEMELL